MKTDFKRGQLPTGPQRPRGLAGAAGPPGIAGLERKATSTALNSVSSRSLVATCSSGKKAIGGGARVNGNAAALVTVSESWPDSSGDKWNVVAREISPTGQSWALAAFALCATVSP